VTTTTPAPSAVADLADRLAVVAGVNAVVTIDPDQGDNACAYAACAPRIAVGDITSPDAMAGTLAHEFAHVRLGHLAGDRLWSTISRWAAYSLAVTVLVAVYALGTGEFVLRLLAVEALTLLLARLLAAAESRVEECDADAEAARLLDSLGCDGRAAVAAYLATPDPWWYRAFGWLFGAHPTTAARIRRIRRNANARPVVAHRAG